MALRVDRLHSPRVEFQAEVRDSETVDEVKEKISKRKGLPVQYIKLCSYYDGTMTLEDDSKTIDECDLGLHPIIWMKPVVLIHITFLELTPELRFSQYEVLEKHATLDDILLKIRETHNLKKKQCIEIRNENDRLIEPNDSLFDDTAEMQVTVYPPPKRSCNVM